MARRGFATFCLEDSVEVWSKVLRLEELTRPAV